MDERSAAEAFGAAASREDARPHSKSARSAAMSAANGPAPSMRITAIAVR
jgi:hypothetical protein